MVPSALVIGTSVLRPLPAAHGSVDQPTSLTWLRSVCRAGYAGGWRVFGLCAASPTRCPSPNGSMYGNIYWCEPAVTEGVGDNFEVEGAVLHDA